jgi:hypothetical protein
VLVSVAVDGDGGKAGDCPKLSVVKLVVIVLKRQTSRSLATSSKGLSYDAGREGSGGGILVFICPMETDLLMSGILCERKTQR